MYFSCAYFLYCLQETESTSFIAINRGMRISTYEGLLSTRKITAFYISSANPLAEYVNIYVESGLQLRQG